MKFHLTKLEISKMDGYQISTILNRLNETKSLFLGIYSYDDIPIVQSNYDGFYIFNTIGGSNTDAIGHWILVFCCNNTTFFFDSMGQKPEAYGPKISNFFYSYPFKRIIVFTRQIQNSFSMVCGAYSIMFAYLMAKNGRISFIKSKFGRNTCKNDEIAIKFLYNLLGYDSCFKFLCSKKVFHRNCMVPCHC